jgi:alkyl hydroperoxide reductase subunit AhpC
MPAYDADADKFAGLNAQVVGISVDSIFSHIAWQEKMIGKVNYPLCSDFYPHGRVAKIYGVLREGPPIPGINDRVIFIIDKDGKIVFSKVYELGEQPDNEEAFEVLKKL